METGIKLSKDEELFKDDIFIFEEGLYGFEDLRKFIFINTSNEEDGLFKHMVSLENPDIGFIVAPPHLIYDNYDIEIDDIELEKIGVKSIDDIIVLSIVVLSKEENKIYINLKSPVILSIPSNKGKQIILDNDLYETRHSISIVN